MPAGPVGAGPRARPTARGLAQGAVLGLVPAMIYLAHAFFGAARDLPALILFALSSLALAVALTVPASRRRLAEMTPVWPVLAPFAAVVGVALLTLTPWVPGGPHPIWAWAGLPPASTLNKSATTIEIIKLLGLGTVFVLGCLLGARPERARTALGWLLGLGGLYAVIALCLFLAGGQVIADGRLTGGFASANIAGTQFGVLVVLAVAWGVRRWSQGERMAMAARIADLAPVIALILLFATCLLLTASRAAISATGVALVLFTGWAALDDRRSRWRLMVVGGLLVVSAVVLVAQGNSLFVDRFGGLATGDDTRAAVTEAHWRAFLDAPLFGYGLGSYPQVNNQIMTTANAAALSASVIQHNAYLQWLEEAGLVGAAPMFVLVAVVLGLTGWRAFRRRRNRALVVGLLAASVVVLLHAAVDVSLNTPSFEAFWALLLGLGFALAQAPSSRNR
jgi:O-antigen ligase